MKPTKRTPRPNAHAPARWMTLTGGDVAGIDRDIETLVGILQKKHGYTHAQANAELVRRLSFSV